jgi:hypothetical protein
VELFNSLHTVWLQLKKKDFPTSLSHTQTINVFITFMYTQLIRHFADVRTELRNIVGEVIVMEGSKRQRHGSLKNSPPLVSVSRGNYLGASSEGLLKASSSDKR